LKISKKKIKDQSACWKKNVLCKSDNHQLKVRIQRTGKKMKAVFTHKVNLSLQSSSPAAKNKILNKTGRSSNVEWEWSPGRVHPRICFGKIPL